MIEVSVEIEATTQQVWEKWISVEAVQHWGFASEDWAAEGIENDVRVGGKFKNRNFAKDGSMEFIFGGVYQTVEPQKQLVYTLDDGRTVEVKFSATQHGVRIQQRFDAETENSVEQQQQGWQAYLDNFKKYVEA
jgi:uncharacterized protein YndB with AHSA1/START domain